MFVLRLMTIGFMIMAVPALCAESPGIKILKDTSDFMVKEFEDACLANITNLKSFNPAPKKPEGYGNNIQYYTNSDKIRLISQLNNLLKNTKNNAQKIVADLEEKESKSPHSDQDILKNFRNIYGILNEGRKNCSLSLSQIEKQELKTQTLKESQSALKGNQEALKNCQAALDKKKPSRLSQAKNLVGLGKKKTEDVASTRSSQKKETRSDENQRILEALQKSGLM